ncbi:hypothetical protein [Arthrobacter humicola]
MSGLVQFPEARVWTTTSLYRGSTHTISLDLSNTKFRALAREFGSEWFDMVTSRPLALSTIKKYASAVRNLLRVMEPYPINAGLSLTDEGSAFCDAFYAWETNLRQVSGITSRLPFTVPNMVLCLLKWRLASGRPLGTLTAARADGSALNLLPPDQPLDELSHPEFQSLRDAARDVVRLAEKRVSRGVRLEAGGQDPEVHGWTLPNALWSLTHQPISTSGILSRLCSRQYFDASEYKSLGIPDETNAGAALMIRSLRSLCEQLSPTAGELQAFRILLLSESGWCPEELTDVRLSHLAWGDNELAMTVTKNRSPRTRTVTFDGGPSRWTTYALVQRLLDITSPARSAFSSGSPDSALFVRARGTLQGVLLEQEKFMSYRLTDFIRDHELTINQPHDIRRIRKTFKTLEGAFMGTARGAAGEDHTVEVSNRHYMQTTTVKVLSSKAVNSAQWKVFDKMRRGPVVVTESAAALANGEADERTMESLAKQVIESTLQDAEIAVTSCQDIFNSPFSPAGLPCHVRPSMCFVCPNALILLNHLPRIVKFQQTLEGQRNSYDPETFNTLWGDTVVNIDAILAAFSPEQVTAAREAASSPELRVHIPLSQKVRFQ